MGCDGPFFLFCVFCVMRVMLFAIVETMSQFLVCDCVVVSVVVGFAGVVRWMFLTRKG